MKDRSKRADNMIATGLYTERSDGIFRPTDSILRIHDQDLDGVHAEVIYGILGIGNALKNQALVSFIYRVYNNWLAEFCQSNPERLKGLACIPNHDPKAAANELRRAAELGLSGGDFAVPTAIKPIYHRDWDILWATAAEYRMPISFHTLGLGSREPDLVDIKNYSLHSAAIRVTMFQLGGIETLASIIFSGACDRYPGLKFIMGESGVSWIPYVLDRMDHEYEDRFYQHLNMRMKPSDFWYRQGHSTYQKETLIAHLANIIGKNNIIWGSDYPHLDSVWPDSQKVLDEDLKTLDSDTRHKIVCGNAGNLYNFFN